MKWELLSTKDLTVDTPVFDGPQSDAMRARYLDVNLYSVPQKNRLRVNQNQSLSCIHKPLPIITL